MIGRKKEQEALLALLRSDESVFAAVYGRRRIGKTYLVRKTFGNRFAFVHAGMSSGNMADQLESFRNSLVACGHRACPTLGNWIAAFEELKNLLAARKQTKKVVFIDELPWLDTPKSRFIPAFEHFWNSWAVWQGDIILIVCGSATSWLLNRVINSRGGLHNRVSHRIRLEPFTLAECEQYAKSRNLALGRRQIAELYMALGGVAFYWSLLERGQSVAQNIDRLFFQPDAPLRNEFRELYRSLFRIPDPYERIVEALGMKKSGMTRPEIAKAARLSDNGALTKYLEELGQCGFIRRYAAFGKLNKDSLFQLMDNFTLFHYTFLSATGQTRIRSWAKSVDSHLHSTWAGLAFEHLCLLHLPQMKVALGISGVESDGYSWRGTTPDGKGVQIDLLIDRADRVVNLCEMKWSKDPYALTNDDIESLSRKREALKTVDERGKSIFITLVTTSGLVRNSQWNDIQSEINLDDLFVDVPKSR